MNDLSVLENLPIAKYGDEKAFSALATSSSFLPRLQLMGSSSNEVKRSKIQQGHWGLIRRKDDVEDLTSACNVLVLGWRPIAMRFGDEFFAAYNPDSPEFKKIEAEADENPLGAAAGPQFLLWLPDANPTCFATTIFASKTAIREAPYLKLLIGKAATLKSQLIQGKKYSWWGPVITPCSAAFSVAPPSMDEIMAVLQPFNNPPESVTPEEAPSEERVR